MPSALSPLDGRYQSALNPLRRFFSEEALLFFRVRVEVEWLLFQSEASDIPLRSFSSEEKTFLQNLITNFGEEAVIHIRAEEQKTQHDVKAVEYFLRSKVQGTSLEDTIPWIHFSLTSEDVNNISYALMLKGAIQEVLLPELRSLNEVFFERASAYAAIPMLSRTHGQPASPTTLGKEFLLFASRLERQVHHLERQDFLGKWAGASGNWNAHAFAIPEADWLNISEDFVSSLGLTWNPIVSQIEPHDFIAEISHTSIRISTIFIDAARDIWGYISLGFFEQALNKGEVGSSAMPHKINPIHFENAEGNFGIANALFAHFAEKLPLSRWQRDLTDSTVLRNLGVAFGHLYLGLQNMHKGLLRISPIQKSILQDLVSHPEVLAEAIQNVMRAEGIPDAYEQLKEITRGKAITHDLLKSWMETLPLSEKAKNRLLRLSPEEYIGYATLLCERFTAKRG